jgi:hypothetical protein
VEIVDVFFGLVQRAVDVDVKPEEPGGSIEVPVCVDSAEVPVGCAEVAAAAGEPVISKTRLPNVKKLV